MPGKDRFSEKGVARGIGEKKKRDKKGAQWPAVRGRPSKEGSKNWKRKRLISRNFYGKGEDRRRKPKKRAGGRCLRGRVID